MGTVVPKRGHDITHELRAVVLRHCLACSQLVAATSLPPRPATSPARAPGGAAHTGQGQADLPDALSHVVAHSGMLGTRPGGTLSTHGLERDQTLVQPQV